MKRRLQWFCSCALLCALLVTAALPAPAPTAEEQLRADVDYIAIMTGVSL